MKNSLKNALPIVARHFADDVGVQLVWGADRAHTWGKTIYLPNLKDEEGVNKLALGFTCHESAHQMHSDQPVYSEAALEPPFVVKFMNVLEDVRIEGLMMGKYPATRDWLSHTVKVVLGGKVECGNLTPAQLLHNAALLIGRSRLLNQPVHAEAESIAGVLRTEFGTGRSTKILALLSKIPSCDSTRAVYHLTHQILDVLDEDEPEEPEEPTPPGDADESDGDDNQGQPGDDSDGQSGGDSGGDQDGAGGDKGDDQGQSGKSDQGGDQDGASQGGGKGAPSQEEGDDAGAGAGAESGDDANGGSGSLKQKVLSAGKAECDELVSDLGDAVANILDREADVSANCSPASVIRTSVGSEMLGHQTLQNGRSASVGLKQVLLGLIQGSRNCRPSARRTGKSIDGSRLARVPVGESRIFRRTEPVQRVNAAFQILLDASGSMGYSSDSAVKPMRIAEESVCALLCALEGIQGVSTGAMVFPRTGPAGDSVGVLKRHNQTLQQSMRENRFGIVESGGTPLAEAIWPAAGDVLSAKGERKVLVVITDGDPNNEAAATEMVSRCRSSGIEVFAIAFGRINTQTLERVFGQGNWKFISDLNLLRSALDQLVRSVLTQTAA